ncbi:MAG: hypothetical protein WBE13_06730, partial [Candidatus Acidiferrum sp.]
ARILVSLKPEDWSSVDIEPYMGEISLNWRNGRDKRVKAIVPKGGLHFATYHEARQNGRVVDHSLRQGVNQDYLAERLDWMHAPL